MQLRVCFENQSTVNVNDGAMMRHYAESYLADFSPEWGGFIMLPYDETRRKRMEPVWQVLIRNADPSVEQELLDYIDRNPMAAYFIHIYRLHGISEQKIH